MMGLLDDYDDIICGPAPQTFIKLRQKAVEVKGSRQVSRFTKVSG